MFDIVWSTLGNLNSYMVKAGVGTLVMGPMKPFGVMALNGENISGLLVSKSE
jgi:hypothetical protein